MADTAFRALADPTRRRILELLAERDRTAGEIASNFSMAFPSISHHLRALKDASLVTAEREGQNVRYRINTTVSQDLLRYLMRLLGRK
jgi:DNA-binding transcriptional ArsR family regulator